ncbi:MAG: hypothetical protein LQ346_001448 [Caloplaca aetnensis]|nr:MAG: hypothetical protein LQ346_001448 [Caloplaca aetnensis]
MVLPATLTFAQGLCSQYGVQLAVPAIADAVATSVAPVASAASAETASAATGSSDTTMATAPVSPDALLSSNVYAAAPTSGPITMASDAGASTATSTPTFLVSIDTKSVIPSATIAKPTDTANQMATTTGSYKSNSTANNTMAASSPIAFVGAAARGHVQGVSMAVMGFLGAVFCGL